MPQPNWMPVICPDCKGEGQKWVDYPDEWHSGWEDCYRCKGKKLIKIDINDLST